MPYYRLTLTINRIAWQNEYSSTRLTAFVYSKKPARLDEMKQILYEFTEDEFGYGSDEWWTAKGKNFKYSQELREAYQGEAKGLGIYTGELVYEDSDGFEKTRKTVDLRNKNFGTYKS